MAQDAINLKQYQLQLLHGRTKGARYYVVCLDIGAWGGETAWAE
jgi:hypothetical protein